MAGGLTRVAALRKLTEVAGELSSEAARDAPIVDLGISPDGGQVAFATERTVFPLGSPAFVSTPLSEARTEEIYDADLGDNTLTRVTGGYRGEPSEPVNAVSGSPSFTADGGTLAFSSTIANLVYGDGNGPQPGVPITGYDGSDAFIVHRKVVVPEPAITYVSPPPPPPVPTPEWALYATAHSRRNGTVVLEVTVPGAGRLSARASGAVLVASHAAKHHGHPRTTVATRTVATAATSCSEAAVVYLTLKLARPYAQLASRKGGLSADVTLRLAAPAQPAATTALDVTFAGPLAAGAKHSKARRSSRHRRHGKGSASR
jgi:hypothetical protein